MGQDAEQLSDAVEDLDADDNPLGTYSYDGVYTFFFENITHGDYVIYVTDAQTNVKDK